MQRSNMDACCTCATLLSAVPSLSADSEKAPLSNRQLPCCARMICGRCIQSNTRFLTYCPYCQTGASPPKSTTLEATPDQPPPPSYATTLEQTQNLPFDSPPPYTPSPTTVPSHPQKGAFSSKNSSPFPPPAQDTLHFLDHDHDTIASLSLRYNVPADALRRANSLSSDYLLAARRTVIIPARYYRGGVSLSPRPVEGEEEETRKAKIRRWMVACKVSDYDMAVVYLEQAGYNSQVAKEAYFADEAWERGVIAKRAAGAENKGVTLPFWKRPR